MLLLLAHLRLLLLLLLLLSAPLLLLTELEHCTGTGRCAWPLRPRGHGCTQCIGPIRALLLLLLMLLGLVCRLLLVRLVDPLLLLVCLEIVETEWLLLLHQGKP